jgi:Multicopper oxidase
MGNYFAQKQSLFLNSIRGKAICNFGVVNPNINNYLEKDLRLTVCSMHSSVLTRIKIISFMTVACICLCLIFDFMKSSTILLSTAQSETQKSLTEISNTETKQVVLFARDSGVNVSPDNQLKPGGVMYQAMTFNGTVPGLWISINQGDVLEITLVNQADAVHSLDLHAAYGSSQARSGSIEPGQNKTLRMKADYPDVFMYHCDGDNLNGIWEHVASGMYGGIIVHPEE